MFRSSRWLASGVIFPFRHNRTMSIFPSRFKLRIGSLVTLRDGMRKCQVSNWPSLPMVAP